jgi:selenocysteine lyase/cysteine desulfurase
MPQFPPDEFLMEPGFMHFNTGTTGASPRAVIDAVADAMRRFETNPPSQAYRATGGTLLQEAEAARARIAAFLGATPDELLLTHGTSNAMNTVAQSVELQPGDRVLTTSLEHEGGLLCWRWLAERRGVALDVVPLDPDDTDPQVILNKVAAAITPRTRVLSVSHVLAWTGLVMPIAGLCALARERGLLSVVDGAQAVGQIPVDVAALGCDAYAGSGHKWLLGPKGTGMLVVRADAAQRIAPVPWMQGKRRLNVDAMGIFPLPQVIGLGVAVARLEGDGLARVAAHDMALRNRLHAELATLPGARVVGPFPGPQACGLVACQLPAAVEVEGVRARLLARDRIAIRAIDPKVFHGLRISTHVHNDDAQVDALLAALRRELGTGA